MEWPHQDSGQLSSFAPDLQLQQRAGSDRLQDPVCRNARQQEPLGAVITSCADLRAGGGGGGWG